MNTSKIGDDFESRSLEIIKRMIDEDQLGHPAKFLKITPKALYYSSVRKKNIVFDLTIEVWPPGAARYIFIYIIECKNYIRRISVDKINDFIFRVNDVALLNSKAIFMTNTPLQEAAFNTAESKGMMVVQGESPDAYKITLYKSNFKISTGKIPFLKEFLRTDLFDTGAELLEKVIDKQIISALQENNNSLHVSYGIDKMTKAEIELTANEELNKMNPDILSKAYHISPKTLAIFLKNEYEVDFVDLSANNNLLGSCDMERNIIGINQSIKETPRELFVMAHEFGHFILHQKLSIGQTAYDSFQDSEYNFRKGTHDLENPKHWIEWQANYFASCFVLPQVPFYYRLTSIQENLNKSKGKIYLDDQYQNRTDFNKIVARLAYRFGVSKTTVIFKLNEMQLINDHSRTKTIGQLIAEYNDLLFT
jgi:Zn-dependent peptidase ImmA (M78 family)